MRATSVRITMHNTTLGEEKTRHLTQKMLATNNKSDNIKGKLRGDELHIINVCEIGVRRIITNSFFKPITYFKSSTNALFFFFKALFPL